MQAREDAYPRFVRRSDAGMIFGVCAGIAAHLRVDLLYVRVVFCVLSILGVGVPAYVLLWLLRPAQASGPPISQSYPSVLLSWLLVVVAVLSPSVSSERATDAPPIVTAAIAVIGVGAVLAWYALEHFEKKRSLIVIVLGAVLVFSGVLVAVLHWEEQRMFGAAVGAVLLTTAGIGALAVPFMVRLWGKWRDEQAAKVVANERAEIAAQLHDSVLQTLALIQKRATEPEVQRLARSQERQLRQWLFGSQEQTTVFQAVERVCGEVEDMFGVRISPVTVGNDIPLNDATHAAVLAAREAMVNAAKHADVQSIDVYAEHLEGLEIFVRDRGCGFDPEQVLADRHGIRDSIQGRVQRAGGEAQIRTAPGQGTEVVIRVPVHAQ